MDKFKSGVTFTGSKFKYSGDTASGITVYKGIPIDIPRSTIDFIINSINNKKVIQMGACRDNPAPGSLGELLFDQGISPQVLSYILPILEHNGFITHFKKGRGFWIKKAGSESEQSIKKSANHQSFAVDIKEILKGCAAYEKYEKRDAMYKVATFLIKTFWGNPHEMADSLGVLLLTWNNAFYRYGPFDFDALENCIQKNISILNDFRNKSILSLTDQDEEKIMRLFNEFLNALSISSGKSKGKISPVGVAKALHLLDPNFLPIWDDKIARAYGCYYGNEPAMAYIEFCRITKQIAENMKDAMPKSEKTILKRIDEFNYSKYTQGWI